MPHLNLCTDLFTKSIAKRIYLWSLDDQESTIKAIRKEEQHIKTQLITNLNHE